MYPCRHKEFRCFKVCERQTGRSDIDTLTEMETENEQSGGKRQNERWDQGVSTDAVKRSSQHCGSGGGGGGAPAVPQLHCHLRQRPREAGLCSHVMEPSGTNLLNLMNRIVHDFVAPNEMEQLQNDFNHI